MLYSTVPWTDLKRVLAKHKCTSLRRFHFQWCDDALNTKRADGWSGIVLSIHLLWCGCQRHNKHLLCQTTLTDRYAQAVSSVFVYWPWGRAWEAPKQDEPGLLAVTLGDITPPSTNFDQIISMHQDWFGDRTETATLRMKLGCRNVCGEEYKHTTKIFWIQ